MSSTQKYLLAFVFMGGVICHAWDEQAPTSTSHRKVEANVGKAVVLRDLLLRTLHAVPAMQDVMLSAMAPNLIETTQYVPRFEEISGDRKRMMAQLHENYVGTRTPFAVRELFDQDWFIQLWKENGVMTTGVTFQHDMYKQLPYEMWQSELTKEFMRHMTDFFTRCTDDRCEHLECNVVRGECEVRLNVRKGKIITFEDYLQLKGVFDAFKDRLTREIGAVTRSL
jgi:hypothetical protein